MSERRTRVRGISQDADLRELAAIVQDSDDAIISKSLDGIIRSWNPGAERLYGYSREEAIGKSVAMLAPPDRVDEIPMIIDRIRRGQRVDHFETLRCRKDGREVYVSLTVSPVRDRSGEIVAASIIARDVTERREMERALQASEHQLQAALVEARVNYERAEQARREAEELVRRLQDVDAVVDVAFAHSSLEDLLHRLLSHVDSRLSTDATMILLVDENRSFEQRLAVGQVDASTVAVFAVVGQSLIHRVVERYEPIVLEDTTGLGERATPRSGMRSVVGVPLLVEGQLIGVLCTGQRRRRIFTPDEVQLLRLVADRAAVAIDNARIYQKTQSVAEMLQRSLLPQNLPVLDGLTIGARYLPAMHGVAIGGDWYDAAVLPDGMLFLAVGDVAGHGIEAAASMGAIRNALRAYALEGHAPASAIEQMIRIHAFERGKMATLICLRIDPTTLRARFVAAGHPPPLVVRPDGSTSFLAGGRTVPLGAFPQPSYPEAEASLDPGSTLLLYTDGLVERRGASIDAGLDRLLAAARAARGDVDAFLTQILERLLGNEARQDDVALIALQVARES